MKPRKCEHLGTRAKAFTLGGVHISEVFSLCKRYKWDREIVFTLGGVHISGVFTMRGFTVSKRYYLLIVIVFVCNIMSTKKNKKTLKQGTVLCSCLKVSPSIIIQHLCSGDIYLY